MNYQTFLHMRFASIRCPSGHFDARLPFKKLVVRSGGGIVVFGVVRRGAGAPWTRTVARKINKLNIHTVHFIVNSQTRMRSDGVDAVKMIAPLVASYIFLKIILIPFGANVWIRLITLDFFF